MIKIRSYLYVVPDETDYGSINNEVKQANEVAKAGNKVFLVVEHKPSFKENEKSENLVVINVPVVSILTRGVKLSDEHIGKIKDLEVDLVFGSAVSASPITNVFGKVLKVPVVNQVLDIPEFRFKYEQYRKQWEFWLSEAVRSDALVVNTLRCKEQINTFFPNYKGKLGVVYYGMDSDMADSVEVVESEEDRFDLVMVGRLVYYKFHDLLLYALYQLKKEGVNLSLALVGEGSEVQRLYDLAVWAGLRVKFFGAVNDEIKFKLIKKCKVCVYSDCCSDISGLFPAEAMFCRKPVVCADMPINRDRFGDVPTFFEPFCVDDLAKKIKKVLSNPLAVSRLDSGRKFVEENRTFKIMIKDLIKFFEEVKK